ncbi:tripartite tricarboxylate transporter permease [Arvimicrobium flavum]|uniref:tripartite tricarboxylate transporter permease n=1 Tax=Arvimicrobium flavum TaxID=3393320 RepID=UPI00237C32C1|nr:tripartite tricarboxylate transporter permease [Mesorhizobium shangrilense]
MDFLAFDFASLFSLANLSAIALGTLVGLIIGALPGLGATIAIVLLLPLTYSMSPLASILLLVAAYQGAEYGGSISSIVLGIPGTPAAVATVLDGNAMAKQGLPGKALGYSLLSSTIGGIVGGLVLAFLAVPLARLAVRFSDPEFFLIGIAGLLAVAALSSKSALKSAISVVLGLMVGTIGLDTFTGALRFTFGRLELLEGVGMVALLTGMFAFSEIFAIISHDLHKRYVASTERVSTGLTWKEFKSIFAPTMTGAGIGSLVGLFPGMGAGPASWFAYIQAKKMSRSPQTFGHGNPEGIAAPESANNAVVGGNLVPLMALGIPGSPATAIILGAFIIHGIQPGPNLFTNSADLAYGLFYGFLLTTVAMYLAGRLVTNMFARALTISNIYLVPIILTLSIVGVYAAHSLFFELWLALGVGMLCFILRQLDYSMPSFILAFILSPIIEESLRRSMLLSDGSYSIFVTRPYALTILLLIVAFLAFTMVERYRGRLKSLNGDAQV